MRRTRRLLGQLAAVGLLLTCGACQSDYLVRRDTASAGSGDAVQANMAVHVIDPWPRSSRRVDPFTDGQRMARAVERYRNPPTPTFGGGPGGAPPEAPVAPSSPR